MIQDLHGYENISGYYYRLSRTYFVLGRILGNFSRNGEWRMESLAEVQHGGEKEGFITLEFKS